MNTVLEAKNLVKLYAMGGQEIRAVDGVSLGIAEGDFVSIMGPSGSGKTTLLNLLGCIDRPASGSVLVNGKETAGMPDRELDRIRLFNIGFVFQKINLIPILSARENIELPMELAGVSSDERRARADELLESVGMSRRAGHRPSQLSAGEQQRIGIARALANRPSIILADEPTGNLDSATAGDIMDYLRLLNEEKSQTLVIVTHDPDVGASAHRTISIRDGKLENTPLS